ncbi:Dolichyl-diphosphooligosaccharide--protein glycosyltransferase subunit 2 [Meloidogyne graminicola]|uniref:Dolichyl-diphosphooligosaccharide--protein glycosyltransferase subunit 2 n=1 Tax=Meloidogyne graminicola TaxID=189291 RepID=A0A8S9ZXS3_9BILA|nr:Dolichyl-diphosphooligosaccharide--protein glycosyltransferase subunit 2 [Meloidogyne graminicola]
MCGVHTQIMKFNYEKLPEIEHQFQMNDARPPVIVSDIFAAICAAPLLILFFLWYRVGLSFGNIKFPWTFGFHIGLSAILGLYASHWLRSDTGTVFNDLNFIYLDMFETLKWLVIIGALTLFCGNRLLKRS